MDTRRKNVENITRNSAEIRLISEKIRLKLKKRVKIRVFGNVQGVFFRYSAKEKAQKLGLMGWARNTGDGTVEIVAEGEESHLNEFLDWCYLGPPTAKVEKVEAEWQEVAGKLEAFRVK